MKAIITNWSLAFALCYLEIKNFFQSFLETKKNYSPESFKDPKENPIYKIPRLGR